MFVTHKQGGTLIWCAFILTLPYWLSAMSLRFSCCIRRVFCENSVVLSMLLGQYGQISAALAAAWKVALVTVFFCSMTFYFTFSSTEDFRGSFTQSVATTWSFRVLEQFNPLVFLLLKLLKEGCYEERWFGSINLSIRLSRLGSGYSSGQLLANQHKPLVQIESPTVTFDWLWEGVILALNELPSLQILGKFSF